MSTSTKTRSPSYPAMGLREAVSRLSGMYKKVSNRFVRREDAATALGYGGLHGASTGAISALVKYGLLEYNKGRELVRVTQRALEIVLTKPGNPDRIAAIREAAFTPLLFADLNEEFGDRPASDDRLQLYLIRKQFNPGAIPDVIRAYRDTMTFLVEEGANLSTDDEEVDEPESEAPTMEALRTLQPAQPQVPPPMPMEDMPGIKSLRFPIGDNLIVETTFKGAVTAEELEAYFEILRLTLRMPKQREEPIAATVIPPMLPPSSDEAKETG